MVKIQAHLGQNTEERYCLQLKKLWINLRIFPELDCENDEDFPDSDLESIFNNEWDDNVDLDRPRPGDLETAQGGRVPCASGYTNIEDEGWNKQFQPNQSIFDDSGCGPRNIPAEKTEADDFATKL
ncbi:T-complex protein 11-like protein 1 [Plakobranchus ocellatus]|uniref:T-complex protein 11-like protein 1 n=1 Tax=Plakobranchus ocellatus TaxID=259542 RepID=A0AAV4CMX2_9GAST|nr:T-complex protein 11-like protein 1 [Plakobranchus ocellatus]